MRMWTKYFSCGVALLLATLVGGACATGSGPATSSSIEDSVTLPMALAPQEQADEVSAEEEPAGPSLADQVYRIGAGDVLRFQSFNDEAFSGQVEVRYDGNISLPLVPDIPIGGLTREEATEAVRQAYESEFLEPRVSLTVTNPRSKTFHVVGDVNQPGEHPYLRPITLLQAINSSGGPRQRQSQSSSNPMARQGQLNKVFIIRRQEGKRTVVDYDLRGFEQEEHQASDAPVYPGDVIYVPETVEFAYVMGEVRSPSVYQISEGMNVLTLLALAGGPVEATGRMRQVVLLRETSNNETQVQLVNMRAILRGAAPPKIHPGDIIYVPQKRLQRASQFIGQLQSVITPSMSMYRQAFDTYYTADRYRRISNSGSSVDGTLLTLEQTLQNLTTLTGAL
jgi:polysaccharide biosynthesis/export protein